MANSRFTWILTVIVVSVIQVAEVKTVGLPQRGERDLILEAFKMQILQKLGMDKPPSKSNYTTSKSNQEEHTGNITELYRQLGKSIDQASTNEEVIRLYPFYTRTLPNADDGTTSKESYRIVFSLPSSHKKRMRTVNIESAMLYFHVVGRNDSDCVLFEKTQYQSNLSDENDTKDTDYNGILSDFDSERAQNQLKIENDTNENDTKDHNSTSYFDQRVPVLARNHFKIDNDSNENDTKDHNSTSYFDQRVPVLARNDMDFDLTSQFDSNGIGIQITINELNATNHQQPKTTTYHRENTGLLTLDFTDFVRGWQSTGTRRIRFQIDIKPLEAGMDVRIITDHCNETELYHPLYRMFSSDVVNAQPHLDIQYFQTASRHRMRRQTSQFCDNFSQPHPCCMKSSIVTFEELGMADLIIAPTSFTASFCTGTCSQLLVQSQLQGSGNYQEQCCGPTEAEDLAVLLSMRGRIVVQRLSNLVVTNCGCT